jgi:hypothetical protein
MISKSIYQPCLKCNKTFDAYSKWGTKSFCSKACANSRGPRSIEFKNRMKELYTGVKKDKNTIKKVIQTKIQRGIIKQKITLCAVCGLVNPKPKLKTCSRDCFKRLATRNALFQDKHGGGRKGKYKGFTCDSTYELAFLIWHLDHNIHIKRSTNVYSYEYKGKISKYIPDFIIGSDEYEIKGYMCNRAKAKLEQNTHIKLVDKIKIKPYIQWVKEKYKVKNVDELYET